MINLNHLTGKDAEDILKLYEGKNPYIRFMKKKFLTEKKYFLTKNQVSYIKDFHNVEPKEVNKIVELTEYFAKQLIEDHKLTTPIKKILVETILAESDKWFHVIGKFYKKQTESKILWLPKSQLIDDPNEVEVNIEIDFEKYTKLDKRGFKLFKHQEEAIKFLMSKKGCILALPMGSGKTMTSILGSLICDAKKILVICPSSLKINWMREIQNFTDDVTIVSSNQWSEAKFTIINYDILKNFHTIKEKDKEYQEWELRREIVNFNPDLIIMDEAHFLKNPKSIRAKILNDITQIYPINRMWLLTGTPVANRPMDYFNLLSLIKSPVASNWVQYARTYCDGKRFRKGNKFVWVTDGSSNLEELAARTKNCLLRKKKEDILDLPEKIISPVYLELKNKEGYEKVWDDYIEKRKVAGKKGNISKDLVETTLLRSFIAMETVPYSIEKTEEALEYGKKVIIFCNFNDEMDAFLKHFGDKAVCVRGGMSDMKKQSSVDRFQTDDKCMVFVGQIKAAGVGLTLTKAEIVIMNSLDWVPGNHEQAEDRCVFKGQQVMTIDGYKNIEDVNINDYVYTHLGNFKKVVDVSKHSERKKLRVDVSYFGYNKPLSVTDDHKIYVYDKTDDTFKWLEAGDLKPNKHYMTLTCNDAPKERKKTLKLDVEIDKTFKNNFNVEQTNGRMNIINEEVELTNDLLFAFGWYVAEGWSNSNNKNKGCNVSICGNLKTEKEITKKVIETFSNSFNLPKINKYESKLNCISYSIYSKQLASQFLKWFGNNSHTKQFPEWVYDLNDEQIESILSGYFMGDGYARKNTQSGITVSKKLSSQLMILNGKLRRPISLNEKINFYNVEYTISEKVKNPNIIRIKIKDNKILYPIKEVKLSKPKRGEEFVYDLTVEDDHSFVVGCANVHNCHRIGQTKSVNIYYMLIDSTIDTMVWHVLKNKKKIINTIVGDNDILNDILEDEE